MSVPAGTTRLLSGAALNAAVVEEGILRARRFVWIATADLKDMHIKRGRGFRPVLNEFELLAAAGVQFRVVHSALPSRPFRASLEQCGRLTGGAMELQICPRSHWKIVVVDGRLAYTGSANFTGAGLGARSVDKRNFEMGVVSTEPDLVAGIMAEFDAFWMGEHCGACKLRDACPDPIA
ncbi:MAG: phospholipase D family protein [Pseudomonadota bacterium]